MGGDTEMFFQSKPKPFYRRQSKHCEHYSSNLDIIFSFDIEKWTAHFFYSHEWGRSKSEK